MGKIPWRRKWQTTPVFLPGKPHEWRSLVGYSPRSRKESDTTERLHFSLCTYTDSCLLYTEEKNTALSNSNTSVKFLRKTPKEVEEPNAHISEPKRQGSIARSSRYQAWVVNREASTPDQGGGRWGGPLLLAELDASGGPTRSTACWVTPAPRLSPSQLPPRASSESQP